MRKFSTHASWAVTGSGTAKHPTMSAAQRKNRVSGGPIKVIVMRLSLQAPADPWGFALRPRGIAQCLQ